MKFNLNFLIIILFAVLTEAFALEDIAMQITEKKFDIPLREVSVIITKEGYYPKNITVFAGEKIRFYVTTTTDEPSCLILGGKSIAVTANKGKIVEAEAYFDRPSEFSFHCPTGKIFGKLVVLSRPSKKEEFVTAKRNIASGSEVRVWKPKEE